ncbi:MAG: polyprenol monophosphomannose synthase [Cyclobacteriaceae bacterium]|nr:polyprenol monophosphomannose synthase [Cyclobacteriaceae bacterium]
MSNAIVIIPTYNERENIGLMINAVFSLERPIDILVVDDNSPDGTAKIVEDLQQKFNQLAHRLHLLKRQGKNGLGTAYLAGFDYALQKGYAFILEMDADFSHDPKDLPRLIETCETENYDMVIGSRYITGVNVVNWPMGRVLLSWFASRYVRLITSLPVQDTTAGFICYRRKVLETIPLKEIKFVGYAFQIELKFKAWKYGFKMKEVPIIFTERVRGQSKLSPGIFKEAFFGVLQLKIQSWFKNYKANHS